MKKLIFATGNENKVKEIQEILKDINIEVLSKKEIGFEDLEVVEDGDTLFENSKKKALALANKIDYAIIADDSGLFVDALNDKPGVHSSRYAGEEGNDDRNNEKLLKDLEEIKEEDRTARFKAVITLITEDKDYLDWESYVNPLIASVVKYRPKDAVLKRSLNTAEYSVDPETTINLRTGIFNSSYPANIVQKEFIIDLDCYSLQRPENKESLLEASKKYNKILVETFESLIEERLRTILKT